MGADGKPNYAVRIIETYNVPYPTNAKDQRGRLGAGEGPLKGKTITTSEKILAFRPIPSEMLEAGPRMSGVIAASKETGVG